EPLGAKDAQRFRIANMDCASEESEIRRALEGMAGIRGLQFNLGDRELAIAADDLALQQALDAIRKAGFNPEPLSGVDQPAAAAASPPGFWATWGKSLGALGLAMVAEGLAFALPDSGPVKVLGMALAAAA
ncbi:heavy-metal-associated domain-containing protein, partial [Dysgonomonas mossii]